jgi:RNA polymerase sigma-70 factor (ECF subfamily)
MTDAEIVARVRAGEKDAYTLLVERYRSAVFALARSHLGHVEDARDVAQETFLQAYERLGQLREPEKFAAWLRRIAANECRMWRRRHRVALLYEVEAGGADSVERLTTRLAVEQALACLSEASRLTLALFYQRACSLQEIADFLEVPVTTVKSRLRDARARLRKELGVRVEASFRAAPLPVTFTEQVMKLTSRVMKPIDREALLRFLSRDRVLHLCLLGELEKAGALKEGLFGEDGWLTLWGVEAGGDLVGALMRIGFNWIPAQSDPGCAALFAAQIDAREGRQLIYGPAPITEATVARLTRHRITETCEESLESVERLAVDPASLPPARRATLADASQLRELYDNPEVPRAPSVGAHIDSETYALRLWFCEDEQGRAVSGCMTRYEASDTAYVDFVYTRPEARGRDYASACLAGMCAELLSEGKRPCFTYDRNDPVKRGDLYRKIGARPYGEWRYFETTTEV